MTDSKQAAFVKDIAATDGTLRHLPLQGAVNFRDLGGYHTVDGRRLKWKHLYRSDSLAELSDADLAVVSGLKLRNLCDLRHQDERDKKPNRQLPDPAPEVHAIGFYPNRHEDLMHMVKTATINVDSLNQLCNDAYGRFHQVPNFARLFEVLLRPDAFPTLIHCTSGKDRTGFATATVLLVLGVPRETIIEDFLLTNHYRRDLTFLVGKDGDPAVVKALSSVEAEYLLSAFRGIEQGWGSEEGYIRNGLKVSREQQQYLQDLLLE